MMGDRRGKCYSCLHCQAQGKTYIEARYRMVAHIYKHHLALDKAPFYCTLCLLRCSTKSALVNHVTRYSRHRQAVTELGQQDSQRFLVENPNPATLVLGVDYRELSNEEATRMVPTKSPSELGEDNFDCEQQLIAQPLPPIGQTPATSVSGNLISIRVRPDVLASLLNSKSSPSIQSTSQYMQQPGFVPYSPTPSAPLPHYTPTPIVKLPGTYDQQTPNQILSPQPSSQPPLKKPKLATESPISSVTVTENQNRSDSIPMPSLSSFNTATVPSRSDPQSTLNTPILGLSNFLDQYVDDELDYDFDDTLTVRSLQASSEIQVKADKVKAKTAEVMAPRRDESTKSTQTEESGEVISDAISKAIGRMVDVFDQNSRAIRCIDKTLGTLTDVVPKMNRTLERMGEEQRREHERRRDEAKDRSRERSRERRDRSHERTSSAQGKTEKLKDKAKSGDKKSEKNKENKPLKSIVNKK